MPDGVLLTYTTLISNNSEHLGLPLGLEHSLILDVLAMG
jgi:hypothetical protein